MAIPEYELKDCDFINVIFRLTCSFQHKFIYKKRRAKYDHNVKKRNINKKKKLTDTRREGIASGNSTVFCKRGHKLGRLDHNYTYWDSALRCVGEQISDCHHASVALKFSKQKWNSAVLYIIEENENEQWLQMGAKFAQHGYKCFRTQVDSHSHEINSSLISNPFLASETMNYDCVLNFGIDVSGYGYGTC